MRRVHFLVVLWEKAKLRWRQVPETGQQQPPQPRPPFSPYSPQYETIISQGHTRPTPSFGAPTLVWHVAIWPRRCVEGLHGSDEPCDPHDTATLKHVDAKVQFEQRRTEWVRQLNTFLAALQARSSPRHGESPAPAKQFRAWPPHDLPWRSAPSDPKDFFKPVEVLEQDTVPFTLWWQVPGESADDAIRVCVHPELNADYAALSFYMDIGKRWNAAHEGRSANAQGACRRDLLHAVEDIRTICERQLEPAHPDGRAGVDEPALPEKLISPDTRTAEDLHRDLKAARNLLYVDIWEQFCAQMGCGIEAIAGVADEASGRARGELFANFRGLVMTTNGLA